MRPEAMHTSTLRFLFFFLLGVLLCTVAIGATPPPPAPMQWSSAFTYYGPTGNTPVVYWLDKNEPPAAWYEFRYIWLERPTKNLTKKLLLKDVTRTKNTTAPNAPWYTVGYPFKAPGQGHFTIEVRSCFSTAADGCTTWTSSISISETVIRDKMTSFWFYFYLAAPSSVTPLP